MIQDLGGDVVPVFAIGCATFFLVIWVVCATLDSLYKTSRRTKLKEQLIERGFSAHEITQIVGAGAASGLVDFDEVRPVPPVKSPQGMHTTA